jgi:hypothetical protein
MLQIYLLDNVTADIYVCYNTLFMDKDETRGDHIRTDPKVKPQTKSIQIENCKTAIRKNRG